MNIEFDMITLFESPVVRRAFNAEARSRGVKLAVYETTDTHEAIVDVSEVPYFGQVDGTDYILPPNEE